MLNNSATTETLPQVSDQHGPPARLEVILGKKREARDLTAVAEILEAVAYWVEQVRHWRVGRLWEQFKFFFPTAQNLDANARRYMDAAIEHLKLDRRGEFAESIRARYESICQNIADSPRFGPIDAEHIEEKSVEQWAAAETELWNEMESFCRDVRRYATMMRGDLAAPLGPEILVGAKELLDYYRVHGKRTYDDVEGEFGWSRATISKRRKELKAAGLL